jgi:hypothetical protein
MAAVVVGGLLAAECRAADVDGTAHFVVGTEVINPDLQPIAATVGAVGNGARFMTDGGFEPPVFRTLLTASADSPDRLIAGQDEIAQYDTLRGGALDGADVDIYRIENGAIRLVRQDRVPEGGFHATGWTSVMPGGRAMPPDADALTVAWEPWYRPGAPTWFTVRAVSRGGLLSPPAAAVMLRSPLESVRGGGGRKVEKDDTMRLGKALIDGEAEGAPAAPTGLTGRVTADGEARLNWDRAAGGGVTGYVVYRSNAAPQDHDGFAIDLAQGVRGPAIRAGDMAILRKTFREVAREKIFTDRMWNAGAARRLRPASVRTWPNEVPGQSWRLRDHASDTPVEEPGRTYLELTMDGPDAVRLSRPVFGGVMQGWYEVAELKPYRVEVWLKGDRPGLATFRLGGDYAKSVRPLTFPISTSWRKATAEFQLPYLLENGVSHAMLEVSGPGVVSVDNFRIYRADTPYMDYLPEEYEKLAEGGMKVLRTHSFIKTGQETYDLDQLTNPAGVTNGSAGNNTVSQLLGIMERAGIEPWLQIEPHFSPDEWRGLIEYLAAPAGAGPWADKRVRQGRAVPWTDAFGKIRLELGNESWNRIFTPWIFPSMTDAVTGDSYPAGAVYGMFQEQVVATLRASPWWKAAKLDDKVEFVIGGWNRQGYGIQAARRSPSSGLMTVATYNGGWDENEGPPTRSKPSFFNVLNQVSQASEPNARRHEREARALSKGRAIPLAVGTYEAGPGYAMNGLNGAKVTDDQAYVQELVMKSQAAGVATLDSFLTQAREGYALQTFFSFGAGERWSSHAEWHQGDHGFPAWKLIALLNREGLGDMLKVDLVSAPRADLKPFRRSRIEVDDAPLAAAYATRRGDRVNLFVISRRIPGYPDAAKDGCTPTVIDLPFKHAARVTLHRMAGPYDANNVESDDVRIETLDIAPPADVSRFALGAAVGAAECGLPPASAFLYVFEGVN